MEWWNGGMMDLWTHVRKGGTMELWKIGMNDGMMEE